MMQILPIFLLFIVMALAVAALARLAVSLLRIGTLSWKHSLYFAGFLFTIVTTSKMLLDLVTPSTGLPLFLGIVVNMAVIYGFAVWFFAYHVNTSDTGTAGYAGGAKAAAGTASLFAVAMFPVMVLFRVF